MKTSLQDGQSIYRKIILFLHYRLTSFIDKILSHYQALTASQATGKCERFNTQQTLNIKLLKFKIPF